MFACKSKADTSSSFRDRLLVTQLGHGDGQKRSKDARSCSTAASFVAGRKSYQRSIGREPPRQIHCIAGRSGEAGVNGGRVEGLRLAVDIDRSVSARVTRVGNRDLFIFPAIGGERVGNL